MPPEPTPTSNPNPVPPPPPPPPAPTFVPPTFTPPPQRPAFVPPPPAMPVITESEPPAPPHKHPRLLFLTGVLAAIVIAAGSFYLGTVWPIRFTAPGSTAATSTPSVANTAPVTIDPSSLTSSSNFPTITGTAPASVSSVSVAIKGAVPGTAEQATLYSGNAALSENAWSYTALYDPASGAGTSTGLTAGSYEVDVEYEDATGNVYSGPTGTLTITSVAATSTATTTAQASSTAP